MEGGAGGVGRLTQATHVADHRDRAARVVVPLDPPTGDRCVVVRAVEREVELDVQLQPVNRLTRALDAQRVVGCQSVSTSVRMPSPSSSSSRLTFSAG